MKAKPPYIVTANNPLSQKPRAMLIVNPVSGTRSKEGLVGYVCESLPGVAVEVRVTSGHGDAGRFAREAVADGGYGLVMSAGGDGTVNETAAALRDTSLPLAILPCGSGNGLARHIGLAVDIDSGLQAAAQGYVVEMDYGLMNGRPFFCTCGVGFDARVSEVFDSMSGRGLLTYLRGALSSIVGYKPEEYLLEADGREIATKALVVAVANASQYGNNAYIAPHASVTDGWLDVTIVHPGNLLDSARVGLDMITRRIDRNFMVEMLKVKHLRITRQAEGPAHVDGDPVDAPAAIEIECRPAGLSIITPA